MKVGDLVRHVYYDTLLPELSCGVVVNCEKEFDLYQVFWYSIETLEQFCVENESESMLEIISESR